MLDLAQSLSTKKKGWGVESSNVLRRVFMHICLSVIRLFALKTIFRYIHRRFDAFCHGNITLTTILLFGFGMCKPHVVNRHI